MAHSFQNFFFRPLKAFSLKHYLDWKVTFNQYLIQVRILMSLRGYAQSLFFLSPSSETLTREKKIIALLTERLLSFPVHS